MTAADRATFPAPVLRTAAGEPPLGIGALVFRDDQGEMFENDNPRYRPQAARIGVLELDDGRYLAHPPGFRADTPIFFASRDEALAYAVDEVVRRANLYMQNGEGEGAHWTADYGHHVIAWALSLKPLKNLNQGAIKDAAPASGHPGADEDSAAGVTDDAGGERSGALNQTGDPVVAELVAAHRLRKQFPAHHTISMTSAVVNGQFKNIGTCACGIVMSHTNYEHLDAAIEAHWRRFHYDNMIDGRGEPIKPGDGSRIPKAKKPRKQKQPGAGGHPAPLASAPSPGPGEGADAVIGDDETGRRAALTAIAAGQEVDGAIVRDLVGEGFVHATTTRLIVTEEGAAFLKNEAAPIGATSNEVVGGLPVTAAPHHAERTGSRDMASVSKSNAGLETCVTAGETATLSDDDDLSIEWPSYDSFLEDKIVTAPLRGIEVARDELHPWLKPHCKDLTLWALRLGCAAIFANFGLHKTAMQLEWCRQLHKHVGGATLNVVPLGVRHGFVKEALQLDMDVRFIRTNAEYELLSAEGVVHFLTNYESIREGKLDPNLFAVCSLDEASVLRSFGSKTYQEFLPLFAKVEFKLVATATPSPNRYKELIHYAGFLGVMDTGLALTRWFQRNSEKAGDLTLYPHKTEEFWMWVHSWAAFLQRPSELGYSDDGYELPPLKLTWHEVPADHSKAEPERDGQGVMFRAVANSLSEAAKARRDSLAPRIAKMSEIIAADPQSTFLIWHDLEAEREAIEAALPEVVTITGSMDIDAREQRLHDFEEGRTKYFGTKPVLSGSGSNFQYHCHKAIYVALPGYGYKFNDFIQSLYRLQRFGQAFPVEVEIIYSEDERSGRAALEEKWARDGEMRARMSEIIKSHGLNTLPLRDALLRTIGVKRVEIKGENFIAINNDAIAECRTWPDNSVDEIITSIPFSNHYEYSASYRDFGHTDDNGHFWSQMDFLTAELLRMLKPGRLACIHVKDRVLFGSVTGEGVPTISPFHAEAIMHYRAHGFQYMGMIHVNTDVVRENAGNYRLGWSENCKDSTKMGVGSPEYVLLLRKRQSDRTKGYADEPVTKEKWNGDDLLAEPNDGYSRARWQIDAHGFWRSSGNRFLTAEEFAGLGPEELVKVFSKLSCERIYDYEAHVKIGEDVERKGLLPSEWMCIAPGATAEHTWHDVNRMRTLNTQQAQKGREKHICLAAGSLVLTRDGYKPIEDVSLGDQVLTHKGRWRPVIVKQNTGRSPAVTIKAHGVSGLTLTPDHKLWTRKVRSLAWSIAHSRKEARRTDPDWVRADETLGSYVNLKLPPVETPSTESLRHWWTAGRWLADGHYSKGARSYVVSCSHHEVDFLIQQLGEHGTNKPHDVGTAVQIILKNPKKSLLSRTLELCGHGAAGKNLPPEAFTLPVAQARALLDGYLSGDGHWLPQRNRWMATSVSRELLLGVAMLAQRAYGAIASLYPGRPAGQATIEGRIVNTKQEWVLSFDVTTDGRHKGKPLILDDGAWKKVRSVELAGEVDTWNLRVAEDESYTAEGCIVKNCPLQFDIVDRLIERYSNEGELIFDPFGGLMTVPYRALLKKRRGAATELSASYFLDGVHYLHMAEEKMETPQLFDLAAFDAVNTPPRT